MITIGRMELGPGTSPRRANLHWAAEESNAFGTHEFLDFCDQLDAVPYINLNVGSGTVKICGIG